jgi:hypothetical protein
MHALFILQKPQAPRPIAKYFQLAQIDQLLEALADNGGMAEAMAQRIAANNNEWRIA